MNMCVWELVRATEGGLLYICLLSGERVCVVFLAPQEEEEEEEEGGRAVWVGEVSANLL